MDKRRKSVRPRNRPRYATEAVPPNTSTVLGRRGRHNRAVSDRIAATSKVRAFLPPEQVAELLVPPSDGQLGPSGGVPRPSANSFRVTLTSTFSEPRYR